MVTFFTDPSVLSHTLKPRGLQPGNGVHIEKQEGDGDPDNAEIHTQKQLTANWIPVHMSLGVGTR